MSTRNAALAKANPSNRTKSVRSSQNTPLTAVKNGARVASPVVAELPKCSPKRATVAQAVAVSGKVKTLASQTKAEPKKKSIEQVSKPVESTRKPASKPVAKVAKPQKTAITAEANKTFSGKTRATVESKAKSSSSTTSRTVKQTSGTPTKTTKSASKTSQSKTEPKQKSETGVRAKRARVPADFALQYGEKAARTKRPAKETAAARKARRNAEEREKLRQLMTPDEELLQRLARLRGEIVPNSNGKTKRAATSTRRSRSWESRCGKCGATGSYKTAAALCIKCGAITMRVEQS